MANNPIQGDDLIDIGSVRAEFSKLIDILKESQREVIELAKQTREALNIKGNTEATTKAIQEQAQTVDKLTKEYDDLTKSEKELLRLQDRLAKSTGKSADETAELKVQIQEANKRTKQAARERLGLVGAYEKESKRLNSLRKQYKDLVLTKGATNKAAKSLKKEIISLDKKLKKLDKSVGQNQRNVGNYTGALKQAAGAFIGPLGIAGAITLTVSAFKGVINITRRF